jgi:hypothetical protein
VVAFIDQVLQFTGKEVPCPAETRPFNRDLVETFPSAMLLARNMANGRDVISDYVRSAVERMNQDWMQASAIEFPPQCDQHRVNLGGLPIYGVAMFHCAREAGGAGSVNIRSRRQGNW